MHERMAVHQRNGVSWRDSTKNAFQGHQRCAISKACLEVFIADGNKRALFGDERYNAHFASSKGLPEQGKIFPTLRQNRLLKELQGRPQPLQFGDRVGHLTRHCLLQGGAFQFCDARAACAAAIPPALRFHSGKGKAMPPPKVCFTFAPVSSRSKIKATYRAPAAPAPTPLRRWRLRRRVAAAQIGALLQRLVVQLLHIEGGARGVQRAADCHRRLWRAPKQTVESGARLRELAEHFEALALYILPFDAGEIDVHLGALTDAVALFGECNSCWAVPAPGRRRHVFLRGIGCGRRFP